MTAWSERSSIVAAMLNPALLAAVLSTSAQGYQRESETGVPWMLSFVVAPMVLHRATRNALPGTTTTHLATWLSRNPVLRAGFPLRAQGLVQPVREGIRFGLAHNILRFEGTRLLAEPRRRPRGFRSPQDLEEMMRKANFVGRWLAKTDSPTTVFALLGVAP
ncbi:three component ABC system middle component [Nonomuraea sp. NPDC049129]|uniref:three component ABC system middle component n=1 Tax=Nonomuraea sp. NPDC049129 TaxID=3155272 RepID=UPI0033F5E885